MTSYRIVEPRRNPRLHTLINALSGAIISQHRTHAAAVAAQHRHLAAVRRERGPDAYVVYTITPPATPLTKDTIRVALLVKGGVVVDNLSNRKFDLTIIDLDDLDQDPAEKRAEWVKLARTLRFSA